MTFSLYVHIPYCRQRCPYCDFNAHAVEHVPEQPYAEALLGELRRAAGTGLWSGRTVDTIFFGGGTPSMFAPETIALLLHTVRDLFPVSPDGEITLEANPGTVDRARLTGYREAGINRVSFGVQSFNDRHLQTLGRIHDARAAARAVDDARAAGFDAINTDLMFGVPGQHPAEWRTDLDRALEADPGHISAYCLTYEEGTAFHAWRASGRLTPVEEEAEITMLLTACTVLGNAGYERYEISNYARPGRACRHNVAYWQRRPYLGVGAGAHSLTPAGPWGERHANVRAPALYIEMAGRQGSALASRECLVRDQAMAETLFLGLRMMEGVLLDEFSGRFGVSIAAARPSLATMLDAGMVEVADGRLRLTAAGLLQADSVFTALL